MSIGWIEFSEGITGAIVGWILGLISGVFLGYLNHRWTLNREIKKLKPALTVSGYSRLSDDTTPVSVIRITNIGGQPVTVVDGGIITENKKVMTFTKNDKRTLPVMIVPGAMHEIEIDEEKLEERVLELNKLTFGQTGIIIGFYVVDAQDNYYVGGISKSSLFFANLSMILQSRYPDYGNPPK